MKKKPYCVIFPNVSSTDVVTETRIPATFEKKLTYSRLLTGYLFLQSPNPPWLDNAALREYQVSLIIALLIKYQSID